MNKLATALTLLLSAAPCLCDPRGPAVLWSNTPNAPSVNDDAIIRSDLNDPNALVQFISDHAEEHGIERLFVLDQQSDMSEMMDLHDYRVMPFTDSNAVLSALRAHLPVTHAEASDIPKRDNANKLDVVVCPVRSMADNKAVTSNDNSMFLMHVPTAGTFSVPSKQQHVSRRLSSSNSNNPKKYVKMTPDLFAGILTGILLVFVAILGFSCLNSIQTPSKFTMAPPPSSREY